MNKKVVYGFVFVLAMMGTQGPLFASDTAYEMERVVVTATRGETNVDKIGGSSVTAITEKDIEAKKAESVEEILKGVPGLDVASNGGPGTKTYVFLRGAEAKNTLILIDGVMVNDASSPNRSADIANLTTDNIERIEIVRGPLSALYGTNATAGVVNIITKKGHGKPSVYAGFEAGSYNTWKAYGGTSGEIDKFNFSMNGARIETDGFSIANDDNDGIPHAGNTAEDDGWDNTTLSGKFGYEFNSTFNITAVLRYGESQADNDDYDGLGGYTGDRFIFPVNWWEPVLPDPNGAKIARQDTDEYSGRIEINNHFFDRFVSSSFYYQTAKNEKNIYDNENNLTVSDGRSNEIGWQGGLSFDTHLLSFGGAYFQEYYDTAEIDEKDAITKSYWAQDQLLLMDGLDIVAGVRVDDHDQFGSEMTYRMAPAYTIQKTETTIKASYGTGFRAPSLFELFADPIPAYSFAGGNENLDPEESDGWDVGFEQQLMDDKLKFGVSYFNMVFEDRIEYYFDSVTYQSTYINLKGKTKTKGIESFIQWAPMSTFSILLNYTYTDTEDPDGARRPYRPLNKISLNLGYSFMEKVKTNLDIHWVDDRDEIFGNDITGSPVTQLDSYSLVNLSAQYDINKHVKVYGRVDNLFDEFYEEVWSYATPGRSAYVGMKLGY
ncbi:MAG: TonB-dependent receptor [Desulfobacterales bacterium]|jgi:vitamin B12 transporter|nr:TonB-dependent receptor [Desulfobacterales bacterium]